jgi:DNA-binding NarL/FixJ family response regulator
MITRVKRVLIADDHAVVRQGLIQVVNSDNEFQVVAQTGIGAEVPSLVNSSNPDILLLDLSMPDMDGFQVLRKIQPEKLNLDIVVLTMYKDEEYLHEALELGVKGYILKEDAVTELLQCIRIVSKGEYYISPRMSRYLVSHNEQRKSLRDERPGLNLLTPTENKILRLIAENKTSHEIAELLCVSIRTIQNHRNNITQKLQLHGYHQLLKFALEYKHLL